MYSDLRHPSDRPLIRDMTGADEVSPCRNCERCLMDKTECAETCPKLAEFQGRYRPVNLCIEHEPPKPKRKHQPTSRNRYVRIPTEQYKKPGRKRIIPEDAKCSYPGCNRLAEATKFKDEYTGNLCHRHYALLSNRFYRNKTIFDRKGNL